MHSLTAVHPLPGWRVLREHLRRPRVVPARLRVGRRRDGVRCRAGGPRGAVIQQRCNRALLGAWLLRPRARHARSHDGALAARLVSEIAVDHAMIV